MVATKAGVQQWPWATCLCSCLPFVLAACCEHADVSHVLCEDTKSLGDGQARRMPAKSKLNQQDTEGRDAKRRLATEASRGVAAKSDAAAYWPAATPAVDAERSSPTAEAHAGQRGPTETQCLARSLLHKVNSCNVMAGSALKAARVVLVPPAHAKSSHRSRQKESRANQAPPNLCRDDRVSTGKGQVFLEPASVPRKVNSSSSQQAPRAKSQGTDHAKKKTGQNQVKEITSTRCRADSISHG